MDCPNCGAKFNNNKVEQIAIKDKIFSKKKQDFIELKGAIGLYQQCKECKYSWPLMEYNPDKKKPEVKIK